jgi:sensor histidine kinase regulating citrate/malate metabolism
MSMISVYIIVLVVTRIFKNIRFYTLAKKEWIMLAVVPVFGIIVDLSLLLNFNSKMTDKQMSTVLFISIGMLVLNVGLFYMIQNIGMREKNIRENDLIYEQSKSAAHLYSNYSRQNKIAHEYKNQLLLLKILIEDEKYEDAQKYIKDINDESNKRINVIETNNAILNALINAKYSETIEKGIATTLNFNDLSRLPVSDMDLIIVLSNMLDNAIEASERISKEKRFIKTKIWLDEEKLLIAVVNNYDGRVKKRGEKILTSKEDNAIHGIGIGNIQSTVEKYGGTTQITTTDTEFRIVSIIPVKEHND